MFNDRFGIKLIYMKKYLKWVPWFDTHIELIDIKTISYQTIRIFLLNSSFLMNYEVFRRNKNIYTHMVGRLNFFEKWFLFYFTIKVTFSFLSVSCTILGDPTNSKRKPCVLWTFWSTPVAASAAAATLSAADEQGRKKRLTVHEKDVCCEK